MQSITRAIKFIYWCLHIDHIAWAHGHGHRHRRPPCILQPKPLYQHKPVRIAHMHTFIYFSIEWRSVAVTDKCTCNSIIVTLTWMHAALRVFVCAICFWCMCPNTVRRLYRWRDFVVLIFRYHNVFCVCVCVVFIDGFTGEWTSERARVDETNKIRKMHRLAYKTGPKMSIYCYLSLLPSLFMNHDWG